MYIWVGINVHEYFSEIRERAKKVERELNYELSCFTLPSHISIKMSFPIKEELFESVVDTVCEYFETLKPFDITVKEVENAGNIVWIRYFDNQTLSLIKEEMNALLKERFDIELHEYDYDFIFHTTLFMDNNEEKNAMAFEAVKNVALPKAVRINRFIVGFSPNGELGTYKVFREIIK